MVVRRGRTVTPALDGDGWSKSARTDAQRFWGADYRTNDSSREKRVLTGVQKVLSAKSLYRRYEISTQQYPLLAQSGHALVHCKSPLLGVKRTCKLQRHHVR